jgi:hypothetical protein
MPPQQSSYAARQPPREKGEKPATVLVTGFGVGTSPHIFFTLDSMIVVSHQLDKDLPFTGRRLHILVVFCVWSLYH